MNSPKFNQSIYPNKCLFYEDVKQFAKVYFVNAVAVRIRQSFLRQSFQFYGIIIIMIMLVIFNHLYSVYLPIPTEKQSSLSTPAELEILWHHAPSQAIQCGADFLHCWVTDSIYVVKTC